MDVYARPYNCRFPMLGRDEQSVQLLRETRTPLAGTNAHPRRVDFEYERAGTASRFLFGEPLAGWRHVSTRNRRTKADGAQEVEELLRTRYALAEKVILVCDNLNTHTPSGPPRLSCWIESVEFDAGVGCGELPFGDRSAFVAFLLPRRHVTS